MTTARDFCNAINPDSPQNRKARAYLAARETIASLLEEGMAAGGHPNMLAHDLANELLRMYPEMVDRHISPKG